MCRISIDAPADDGAMNTPFDGASGAMLRRTPSTDPDS
jgi:hypothetical protein